VAELQNQAKRAAKRFQRPTVMVAAGALLVLGLLMVASGQEAVRMSMASAQAAEARRRAATTVEDYSLELGPTVWRLGAALGLAYNDHVRYSESNPESDFIVRPQISTRMVWPVSDRNSLNLSFGTGYSAYLQQSGLSRFFITPDSEVSFDLYAGDFWINLHDRISITEYGYQDPTVAGTGDYSQFENTAGVDALWDLNKAVLRWGYDHQIYGALSGGQGRPDGQSDVFSFSPGYAPKPGLLAGAEFGGALIHYNSASAPYSEAAQWNIGAFYDSQVSQHVHLRASGGYVQYAPDSSQTDVRDFSGLYAQCALSHRVNQHVSYSLNGSRTVQTTLQGGSVEMYSVRWQASWRVIRRTSLWTSFVYNHGSDLYSGGETFDQYGPQIRLGWRLSDRLSGSLGYRVYWRDSDESDRGYSVNIVSLGLHYVF